MTRLTCAEIHDLAPELALGLVAGPERAAALEHLDRCADCRATVADLTRVVDLLLVAGPEVEPPAGFETRALDRMGLEPAHHPGAPPSHRLGRRRWVRPVAWSAAAAIVVVALAVAVGLAVYGRRDAAPALRAAPMVTPSGVGVGRVEVGGRPASLFVSMPTWYGAGGTGATYRLRLDLSDGTRRFIGPVVLADGGTWGTRLRVDPARVGGVALTTTDGRELCHATLSG